MDMMYFRLSLLFKHEADNKWSEIRMTPTSNDEYLASFQTSKQGYYSYKIEGWVDYALNWQHGLGRKIDDSQHVSSELLEGAELISSNARKGIFRGKKLLTAPYIHL